MYNLADIIQKHPNFDSIRNADPDLWKEIRISDRIALANHFTGKKKLAFTPTPKQAPIIESSVSETIAPIKLETFSLAIELNELQEAGKQLILSGKSCCITGKAGTGKTTLQRAVAKALLDAGWLPEQIGIGSFTRVATGNIRKAIEKDTELGIALQGRIVTFHKHLEYKPFFWEELEIGKKRMEFRPTRNEYNKLTCKVFIAEESSMWDLNLYRKFYDAMQTGTQMIFIGDINQLPPVFGSSIFNYALGQLPVIELTEVYRQALDSGIIQNALRVLDGKIPENNKDCIIISGDPKVKTGQTKLAMGLGRVNLQEPNKSGFFHKRYLQEKDKSAGYEESGYDPLQDVILAPWNKQDLGTDAMNGWIAQFLGDERQAIVHEIIAGRNKHFLAIGDQVYIDKQQGTITAININGGYIGKSPRPASPDLLRCGQYRIAHKHDDDHQDMEALMAGYESMNADESPDEDKKNQASHVVYIRLNDADEDEKPIELQTAGDFAPNKFSLGYCLTTHKAQGCEWRKVFIIMHEDHCKTGNFLSREWLYTAITRAKEKLVVIARKHVLERAVSNQIIKGKTLDEKIALINSGAKNIGNYPILKIGEWENAASQPLQPIQDKPPSFAPSKEHKIPFQDLESLVPQSIKDQALVNLSMYWKKAKGIWGDSLGDQPNLQFNCQKATVLGLANTKQRLIKLNPAYSFWGIKSEEAKKEMLKTILAHEICHIIAGIYGYAHGHESGWIMAMKLMGQAPDITFSNIDDLGNDIFPHYSVMAREMLGMSKEDRLLLEEAELSTDEQS